jgi:hypothetical protein
MSDLISRSALLAEFQNPDLFNVTEKHLSLINNAPTVDAVEVVRCKDCICYTEGPMGTGCRMIFGHHVEVIPRKPDDFCSYGEKEGAD